MVLVCFLLSVFASVACSLVVRASDLRLNGLNSWLYGTFGEHRSVTGELSLSYARPAADG